MTMRAAVLTALVGCGFSPPASSLGGPADAPMLSSDAHVAMPDAPVGSAACYAPDMTGIKLCLELDDSDLVGSGIARDGSPGRHDATVTDGDVTTRPIPASSPAQLISTTTAAPQATIQTADDPDFDLAALTLMAWVSPSATPDSIDTYGLIEKRNQWVMELDSDGDLECLFAVGSANSTVGPAAISVPLDEWSLVACTYDGTRACAFVATGGSGTGQQECLSLDIDLASTTDHGVMIGSRWDSTLGVFNHLYGSIDSARIFDHALSASQICLGGGRTGC